MPGADFDQSLVLVAHEKLRRDFPEPDGIPVDPVRRAG